MPKDDPAIHRPAILEQLCNCKPRHVPNWGVGWYGWKDAKGFSFRWVQNKVLDSWQVQTLSAQSKESMACYFHRAVG